MREFFFLRKLLYERRKDYLLAKLRKEFETISNKVRFILGVISEEIKVSRVKKRVLVTNLKKMGFSTHSELNEILPEKKRATLQLPNPDKPEEEEQANPDQEEETLAPGEVSIKEYDYLLTMQIMSLTEERVLELQKLMKDKKVEYDRLEALHIYDIWQSDLEKFLIELEKYEAQEEKDRLAHTAAANGQKGGKGKGKTAGGPGKKRVMTAGEDKKPRAKATKDDDYNPTKKGQQKPQQQRSMADFVKPTTTNKKPPTSP